MLILWELGLNEFLPIILLQKIAGNDLREKRISVIVLYGNRIVTAGICGDQISVRR